jgi:hypothetical protein
MLRAMRRAPLVTAAAAVVAVLAAAPKPADAGLGIGLFVGEPLGLTVKVDLQRRTALEILGGVSEYDNEAVYGHLTFLATPFVANGRSVLVPFRIGIGAAIYEYGNDIGIAARVPFQVGFQFRSAPIEIYLELAMRLHLVPDGVDLDLDGGLGFRFYF